MSGFPYDRDTPVKSRCSSCLAGVHHGPQHGGVCECECHREPYDRDTPTEARETLIGARRYADAVRARRASLHRHVGHDGPTVCACTECVLWSLLDGVLDELTALWPPGPERDARRPRPHPDAGRLA